MTTESRAELTPAGTPQFDMVIAWLNSDDPVLVGRACQVLVRLDAAHLPTLVNEALDTKRSDRHRVRILDVIEHMNHPLPAEEWFKLLIEMTATRSEALKLKICGVMEMHRNQLSRATPA